MDNKRGKKLLLLALFAAWCAMLLLRPGIGTGPG
jgi:hypothetical protein